MSNAEVANSIVLRADERQHGIDPGSKKTALVIQGGGLKAVTSCAAAAALDYLGLTNAFDMVYGSSAGAVNAAYFVAGQAALGITVYHEDVNNNRFVNLLRWRKIMDLEYLFDDLVRGRKRHHQTAMENHPTEVQAITTDKEDSRTVWFSNRDQTINFYDALKASCALPLVYPRGVLVGGRLYIDGGLKEPIPILTVVEEDYTDILALVTQHTGYRSPKQLDWSTRTFVNPLLRRILNRRLYEAYESNGQRLNRAAEMLAAGEYVNRRGHRVRLAAIGPDPEVDLSSFERSSSKLLQAAYTSWRNTLRFFGDADDASDEHFLLVQEQAKQANRAFIKPDIA